MRREMYWCEHGSGMNCHNPKKSGSICCGPRIVQKCKAYKRMTDQRHNDMIRACRRASIGARLETPKGSYIA